MATKQTEPDSPDNLLYIHIDGYKGHKQDILTQKLSKLENKLLICPVCHGIAREAVVCEGKTICTLCTAGKPYEPNDDVRESVNELNVICPLNYRGCKWKGELRQVEQHVLQCDHLLILCNLECSTVLAQYDLTQHITHICPMRKLPCEFCEDSCLAKNVNEHLTKCPAYILDCPQGCMERVRRDNMNEHTEIHCEMKKEPCAYHEFGCKTNSIAKRDVQTHQQQHVVSHQECLYQQIKITNKELNIVTEGINEKVDQLEKVCSEQKEQIVKLENVITHKNEDLKILVEKHKYEISILIKENSVKIKSEQKERIRTNEDINKLKSSLAKQEKLNKDLIILFEMLTVKPENRKKINTSLTIMKIQMGQEITSKEFEFFDKFDWGITDVSKYRKNNQKIESPIFQLYGYNLQCQTQFTNIYLGVSTGISISIRCLIDKASTQGLHFCYYQVQIINRNDENKSIVKKGKIDCVITGDYMEIAGLEYFAISHFIHNDSILIRIQMIPTHL